ncbi:MAG: hypothetical protein PVG64_00730 [Syntrophobacterales bacterium]
MKTFSLVALGWWHLLLKAPVGGAFLLKKSLWWSLLSEAFPLKPSRTHLHQRVVLPLETCPWEVLLWAGVPLEIHPPVALARQTQPSSL